MKIASGKNLLTLAKPSYLNVFNKNIKESNIDFTTPRLDVVVHYKVNANGSDGLEEKKLTGKKGF